MSSRRAPLYSSWGRGRLGSTWSGWWGTPCPACWWSKRHLRGVKPQDSATSPPCWTLDWYMRTSRCGLFLLSPSRSRCWRSPCWRRGRRSSWWSSRLHACFFFFKSRVPVYLISVFNSLVSWWFWVRTPVCPPSDSLTAKTNKMLANKAPPGLEQEYGIGLVN